MRRIHKVIAICGSTALVAVTLTPAALAAGAVSSAAAGHALTLPNSNIKGSPVHWSPSSLTAKARYINNTTCTTSEGSFTQTNTKNVPEKIKTTATGITGSFTSTIPAHKVFVFCITKGYTGTVHVTLLADGKKLTVTFP